MSTTVTITMTYRSPVRIVNDDWPVIARGGWYSGPIECQANEMAFIKVRKNADGRCIVYGRRGAGPGGQVAGYHGSAAGYLLADDTRLIEHIRCVGASMGCPELANDCIADLPPESVS